MCSGNYAQLKISIEDFVVNSSLDFLAFYMKVPYKSVPGRKSCMQQMSINISEVHGNDNYSVCIFFFFPLFLS